jgi:hypothetical protein
MCVWGAGLRCGWGEGGRQLVVVWGTPSGGGYPDSGPTLYAPPPHTHTPPHPTPFPLSSALARSSRAGTRASWACGERSGWCVCGRQCECRMWCRSSHSCMGFVPCKHPAYRTFCLHTHTHPPTHPPTHPRTHPPPPTYALSRAHMHHTLQHRREPQAGHPPPPRLRRQGRWWHHPRRGDPHLRGQ